MTETHKRIGSTEFFLWEDAVKLEGGFESAIYESVHEIEGNTLFEIVSGGNTAEIDAAEGWFYWCCFPGCLPEGEPMGPFETLEEAEEDAKDNGFIDD
jgi:hypothetical protein